MFKSFGISHLVVALSILTASCSSGEKCEDCEKEKIKDTVVVEDNINSALASDTIVTDVKEKTAIHDKIVKKYGEQWDFCKCVVASDSITDAFEKKLTSAQETKLMARWDYVDIKCKELTTNPSTTPEERAAHEKKVNKCLKQNGLKK